MKFPPFLRGARFRSGAFRSFRLRRRRSDGLDRMRLERFRYQLLGRESRLRETETQPGQIQGGVPDPGLRHRVLRFEIPFRRRHGCRIEITLRRQTPFVIVFPGSRHIPGHGRGGRYRKLSGFFRLGGGTREKSDFVEFDGGSHGRFEFFERFERSARQRQLLNRERKFRSWIPVFRTLFGGQCRNGGFRRFRRRVQLELCGNRRRNLSELCGNQSTLRDVPRRQDGVAIVRGRNVPDRPGRHRWYGGVHYLLRHDHRRRRMDPRGIQLRLIDRDGSLQSEFPQSQMRRRNFQSRFARNVLRGDCRPSACQSLDGSRVLHFYRRVFGNDREHERLFDRVQVRHPQSEPTHLRQPLLSLIVLVDYRRIVRGGQRKHHQGYGMVRNPVYQGEFPRNELDRLVPHRIRRGRQQFLRTELGLRDFRHFHPYRTWKREQKRNPGNGMRRIARIPHVRVPRTLDP